jgi:ABC-type sugar transport system permease subunit
MRPELVSHPASAHSDRRSVVRLFGLVLLIPAVVLAVITLVIPTVRTISLSFRAETLLSGAASRGVGFDNYGRVFGDGRFWPSVGFSLSLVLAPIVLAVVVSPLLAAAFVWAGGWARWAARIVLSLTLVVFSPVALAIAWQRRFRDDPGQLADPDLVGNTFRVAVAMMTVGVVLAVGVLIFLPVLRARESRRSMWPALFAVAGVTLLGLLAIGLQLFTVPFMLTRFGPANQTLTPAGLVFQRGFQNVQAGLGAAVATVLLGMLAVLGVGAVLIVILTRLRVSLVPSAAPRPTNVAAIVVAAVALAAMVVVIVLNALPWLHALSGDTPPIQPGTQRRTWGPAVSGALISVGVAYLAALGISGLRPLGRRSEWLLLPFAPWLFVGVAPLSIDFFRSLRDGGGLNTSSALQPPILVSVVALVVLAILCRGQSEQWQRELEAGAPPGDSFVRSVVFPTLPLAGFLAVVAIFLNAQDLLWPLLVAQTPEIATAPLALDILQNAQATRDFSVAATTPLLAVILGFLALAALGVLYLDRMVAATGGPQDDGSR